MENDIRRIIGKVYQDYLLCMAQKKGKTEFENWLNRLREAGVDQEQTARALAHYRLTSFTPEQVAQFPEECREAVIKACYDILDGENIPFSAGINPRLLHNPIGDRNNSHTKRYIEKKPNYDDPFGEKDKVKIYLLKEPERLDKFSKRLDKFPKKPYKTY
ncbi:MAG: hypothetical protein WC533_01100 [Candidatus Pacearchaeota archaeon]